MPPTPAAVHGRGLWGRESVAQRNNPDQIRSELSAGGVVYRRRAGRLEVLVGYQRDWNSGESGVRLPKGHLEPGETLEAAALREVAEETGRSARIERQLAENRYEFRIHATGERVDKRVVYFLMEDAGESNGPRDDEMERVEWLPVEAAIARLRFENEKDVVREAAEALHSASPPQ